jgi:hypothetical protein
MTVVDAMGEKVNIMIKNQREEYLAAYEFHMVEILKKLHTLREQLVNMSHDKTREERIQLLNIQKTYFESEMIKWNNKNCIIKKRLAIVSDKLKEAGK